MPLGAVSATSYRITGRPGARRATSTNPASRNTEASSAYGPSALSQPMPAIAATRYTA